MSGAGPALRRLAIHHRLLPWPCHVIPMIPYHTIPYHAMPYTRRSTGRVHVHVHTRATLASASFSLSSSWLCCNLYGFTNAATLRATSSSTACCRDCAVSRSSLVSPPAAALMGAASALHARTHAPPKEGNRHACAGYAGLNTTSGGGVVCLMRVNVHARPVAVGWHA